MDGLHLVEDLLTVRGIHLRKLRREHRIHLIFEIFMLDLHIGKGQKTGREILRCGEGTLTGIGIEQHLTALRTVVIGQQSLSYQPFAEELAHLRLQHTTS